MSVSFAFDFDKALAALLYLASKPEVVPGLDKYKAGKLLFLAEKYHLVQYGRPIFGDTYKALPYGPVPQLLIDLVQEMTDVARGGTSPRIEVKRLAEVLDVEGRYRYPRLVAKAGFDAEIKAALSASDVAALDHVIALHGRKSFDELKALTHEMPAYRRAWESRPAGVEVKQMDYEDFFEEDQDAIDGAKEHMLENAVLREAFPAR